MGVTKFDAPWSRSLWIISMFSIFILCGVAALPISGFCLARLLPIALLLGALPFVVRRYEVREGILLIRRLWWDTRLDLSELRAGRFDPSAPRGSIRTCGNGGLFSFTGWYWSRQLGTYRAYLTDFRKAVVLDFSDRRVVVSPDDPERFVRELMSYLCSHSGHTSLP